MANVYGNNGNRWWIGQNVGEAGSEQTVFGTPSLASLNPFTPSGYQTLSSGNAADDALFAAAAKANKGSTSPNTIRVESIEWFNIQGPYTTQAAANAAIPAIKAANPSPGVLGQVQKDNASNPVGTAASVVSDAESVSQFLSRLSSAALWIRVAKVGIGGIILIVGLAKLTGLDSSASGSTGKVLKSAVKVAPLL